MRTVVARCWKYVEAALYDLIERKVDPRLQVEMAVEEARRRHQLLAMQAASVLGNERELDIKVDRAMHEVERLRSAAGRALVLSDRARVEGRAAEAANHERTALLFATRLAAAQTTAAELDDARERAAAAAFAARTAVERSADVLNTRLAEASRLMTQIEATRMQERVADALSALDSLAPRASGPTLEEVRSRLDRRISLAAARTELAENGTEARMLAVERATIEEAAAVTLSEIRGQLGLPSPEAAE